MSTILKQFQADIEAFLVTRAMNATEFGLQAMGDSHFVHALRRGRNVRTDTIEKVRKFMEDYKPTSDGSRGGHHQEVAAA